MSNLTCRVDIVEDFIQVQKYVIPIFTASVHTYMRHCDGSFVQWFCSYSHDPWTDHVLFGKVKRMESRCWILQAI
jgi:hypothetical protein